MHKRPYRRAAGREIIAALVLTLCAAVVLAQELLLPQLTQDGQQKKNGTVVDTGNAAQGYIQIMHKAGKKRRKVRITKGDQTYTYDLNAEGEFEVFPLQMGDGKYTVNVFEQVKGKQYSNVSQISFTVELADESLPYLYPNQYVAYDGDSEAVALAQEICGGLDGDEAKMNAAVEYITGKCLYDYMKALTVNAANGYMPDVDATVESKTGICFDFAALMCCMMRSQGIPARLAIGYADRTYHAWNYVYIDGTWRLVDTTAQITSTRVRNYTLERYY